MLPVDGYIRVSRVAGREGESFISPGEQRKAIEGWAKLHGREIGEVFEDLDQSGKARHRPGLDAAMERVISGVSGGVVVAKLDRFGRSVPHLGELLSILDDHDAALYAVAEGLDTGGNTGRMVATILSAIAEFEVNRQAESWYAARRNAVERGVFVGGNVPLGYEKVDGRLVVGPQADIVREIFRRRVDGHGWQAITDYVAAETGRTWPVETVRYLVRNRTYLGEIHGGQGIVNPEGHEPIIDAETFAAANAGPRVAPVPSGRATGLLAGILRCASCRYSLRYSMAKTRHGKPRADYRCQGASRGAGGCPDPVSVSAAAVEPYIVDEFLRRHSSEGAKRATDETAEVRARVAEAEAELDAILSAELRAVLGEGSEAYLKAVRERQAALDRARSDLEAAEAISGRVAAYSVEEVWPDLTVGEQRSLLAAGFDCVFVRPGGRVPERLFICGPGEAPDLPVRGQRWTPVGFPFPAVSRGEDAG